MCLRKFKVTLVLISMYFSSKAQHPWSFILKQGVNFTQYTRNKDAPQHNSGWDMAVLDFRSDIGFTASLGAAYQLNKRTSVFADLRYNFWGGYIKASDPNKTNFYIDLWVRYSSLSIPLGIKYTLIAKPKINVFTTFGAGFDYSYKLFFLPSNQNGHGYYFRPRVDILTKYLHVGVGIEKPICGKLYFLAGLECHNDYLLNPIRYQDFGGYFGQSHIPLSYTQLFTYVGLKLQP